MDFTRVVVAAALAASLVATPSAGRQPLRPSRGKVSHAPAARVVVAGAALPLAEGEGAAAWVRLGRGRVAAAVWTGLPAGRRLRAIQDEDHDAALELRVYRRAGASWQAEAAAMGRPTYCDAPFGCESVRAPPKPTLTAFGDGLVMVRTTAVTMCSSGQDACPPLPIGVLFDVASQRARRIAVIPLAVYTGEEPADEQMRHRIFHFEPTFDDRDGDGRTDLTLVPTGVTRVREVRGTHVVTRQRIKRRRPALAMTWLRAAGGGLVPEHATVEAWVRAPLKEAEGGAGLARAVTRLEEAVRLAAALQPDRLPGDVSASWEWACLVHDATGSGPSCATEGLAPPGFDPNALPTTIEAVRRAAGERGDARANKRLEALEQLLSGA